MNSLYNLFIAIRRSNLEEVKELLKKKPELIKYTAKSPFIKDDGQSPLQIALKTGNLVIADYLLDLGADVNFIESETCVNKWRAPVIHDAINAAIMNCRCNTYSEAFGLKQYKTKEDADKAFKILNRIVDLGADVNAKDSYGNSCIWHACLQTMQIIPDYNYTNKKLDNNRILTDELLCDLSRIFKLLISRGADLSYIAPNYCMPIKDFYKNEPVVKFLN